MITRTGRGAFGRGHPSCSGHPGRARWSSEAGLEWLGTDNLAIKGVAAAYGDRGRHIITCATEHKAVLDTAKYLEGQGFEVTYMPVDSSGGLDLELLERTIRADTILVSLMAANNEIGAVHPLVEIGNLTRGKDVLFHSDAAQAIGKIPLDVEAMNLDLVSISAHKLYGPKGIGALYVRRRPAVKLSPLVHGGGHERGLRSGTLNVPGCVGLGAACELAQTEFGIEPVEAARLTDLLQGLLMENIEGVQLNGPAIDRLPGNLNLSFAGVEADVLMARLPEVAMSSGSACTSATPEPSHVLRALGFDDDRAYSSIRFGIGRFNSEQEVRYVAKRAAQVVAEVRAILAEAPTRLGSHP